MNLSESTRAYIYRALLALQPLAVAYGLATDNMAALWINVAAAVLGLGLATAKTSTLATQPTGLMGRHVIASPELRALDAEADEQAAANDHATFPYA